LNRSTWIIEKVNDPFDPYFIRKIPSILGTDAPFSPVSWYDQLISLGRTGVISTDSRESLRIDNKIPYLTLNEIDPSTFDLTYGGFDRINGQFLFSFRSIYANESLPDIQDKILVNNYEEKTWAFYNMRFSCLGQSTLGTAYTWNDIYEVNKDTWVSWNTTEEVWNKVGLGTEEQKTLAGDDYGFVYEMNADYNDYATAITSIVKGTTTTININAAAFEVGDSISILSVEGMTEINDPIRKVNQNEENFWPIVLSKTLTSITIDIDSSGFSNWTSGGIVSKVIEFEALMNPFNPYRSQGKKVYVSHVEFLLDTRDGGSLYVSVYQDEEETAFIEDVLVRVQPTNTRKAREWITMTVNQEANFITLFLQQSSSTEQLRITSIRIHCSQGGLTSS
jgi:hypothetical protein